MDGDGTGLDELHRGPALELAVAEPVEPERAVRTHADGVDQARHEATQRVRVFEPMPLAAVQVQRRKHAPRQGFGLAVRLSRAERREQTRQELLTAAEACFVTRGFHATSVDEVAERAGYTKGAVYSNFAAKEDLFFAVYERRVERVLTEVAPGLRQAGAQQALDWLATTTIDRRDRDDGWLAVFFEFWGHVVRHPELRERFAAIHARFLELLAEGVRQLAEDRGLALPTDVTASQVALAWNAMEVGLGLERLAQPRAVDGVLARRMGWLLLDAVLPTAQPSAGNDGPPQDRRTR